MNKKTLTQVVLPITIIGGLVFGITYIMNYSRPKPSQDKGDGPKVLSGSNALKFTVVSGRNDPTVTHLKFWRNSFELGEHGHFDFWFQNANDQAVRVAFIKASCQCGGADLGTIPADAWADYLQGSVVSGFPGLDASPIIAAVNTAKLAARIHWTEIAKDGKLTDGSVPASSLKTGPQVGILRLNWYGKAPEGDKHLTAELVAQLPGSSANAIHLEANYMVIPPFSVIVPATQSRDVRLGNLGTSAVIQREFVIWSKTKPELPRLVVTAKDLGDNAALVNWSEPVALTADEMTTFVASLPEPVALGGIRCAYRVQLTVHERQEIEGDGKKVLKQLDIGPIDFKLQVTSGDGGGVPVPVSGMVRGAVRLLGSANDRIDFGSSFPSNESRSMNVTLISDRRDLDLELATKECTPDYLQCTLTPEPAFEDRKQWILRVTIPADYLSGTLNDAFVILKTKDAQSRRIRIPIKATAYFSSR